MFLIRALGPLPRRLREQASFGAVGVDCARNNKAGSGVCGCSVPSFVGIWL